MILNLPPQLWPPTPSMCVCTILRCMFVRGFAAQVGVVANGNNEVINSCNMSYKILKSLIPGSLLGYCNHYCLALETLNWRKSEEIVIFFLILERNWHVVAKRVSGGFTCFCFCFFSFSSLSMNLKLGRLVRNVGPAPTHVQHDKGGFDGGSCAHDNATHCKKDSILQRS